MKWNPGPRDIRPYQGFIYEIVDTWTGKYYIGKKFFWSKKIRPALKGRKNKRHYVVESDWKDYLGSNKALLNDIVRLKYFKDRFEKRILKLCKTKFDCAYEELKEQMKRNVLFDQLSYNEIINVRLRRRK